MKVDGELDRSRFGAKEPGRSQGLQQPTHGPVVGQHERGELGDAFVPGAFGQPLQQHPANPTSLPGLEDRHSNLRAVGPFAIADVAGDADALAASLIDREQRLVIPVVDFGEVAQLGGG